MSQIYMATVSTTFGQRLSQIIADALNCGKIKQIRLEFSEHIPVLLSCRGTVHPAASQRRRRHHSTTTVFKTQQMKRATTMVTVALLTLPVTTEGQALEDLATSLYLSQVWSPFLPFLLIAFFMVRNSASSPWI